MATPEDGSAFAHVYRSAVVGSPISFEIEPPDGAEMARRVAGTIARFPWLAFEENGVALGYAYAGTHRARPAYQWSAEVSAYVHETVRRRGIARALYTSLFVLPANSDIATRTRGSRFRMQRASACTSR